MLGHGLHTSGYPDVVKASFDGGGHIGHSLQARRAVPSRTRDWIMHFGGDFGSFEAERDYNSRLRQKFRMELSVKSGIH